MPEFQVEATASVDGEVVFAHVRVKKGDRVTATIRAIDSSEAVREAAKQRFLENARTSTMKSDGRLPSRSELYDRN